MTRIYFKKFNLRFSNQDGHEESFVNFRISTRADGVQRALGKTSVSASNATKQTRDLLRRNGVENPDKFTERSMKLAGMNALCDTSSWSASKTLSQYRNTSKVFRK